MDIVLIALAVAVITAAIVSVVAVRVIRTSAPPPSADAPPPLDTSALLTQVQLANAEALRDAMAELHERAAADRAEPAQGE